LAAVDLLESNWKLVQNVLQLTHHVLIHMFVGFWTKKRKEMPGDNLRKLLEAFDTTKDHVLALKRMSVKRGVEGVIALAQSHGKEVDWEKVGSSHARPPFGDGGIFPEGEEVCTQDCISHFSIGSSLDICAKVFDDSFQHPCC
jgi:hypothetical protein